MLNFSNVPYFDDHTHAVDIATKTISPLDFVKVMKHGHKSASPMFGMTADESLKFLCTHMGVAEVMINRMAQYFGCEADIDTVIAARNKLCAEIGPKAYAYRLYKDAKIIGTTVDLPWALHEEKEACFGCPAYRLYQMDPMIEKLQAESASYDELLDKFTATFTKAIDDGYCGFKAHIGETYSFAIRNVSDEEARAAFNDLEQYENCRTVYYALFAKGLKLCMEKGSIIHVHTGCTGGAKFGLIEKTNPQLMIPFLNTPEYIHSPLVLLHCNYPNVRAAAEMAHTFPNVWVDLAWVLPWAALEMPELLKTVIGIAPHNKIMLGTGQHMLPEIAWVSAFIARKSLEKVLTEEVEIGFLSEPQAQEIAELLMYKNALNLYHYHI